LAGTDATHAEHIETIKSRMYVGLQDGSHFVPGELGMGLVEGYDNMGFPMSKPYLRAELEADLKRICDGIKDPKIVLAEQLAKYKEVFRMALQQVKYGSVTGNATMYVCSYWLPGRCLFSKKTTVMILMPIIIMLMGIVSGVTGVWASSHDGSYVVNIPKIFTIGKNENFSLSSENTEFQFTRNQTCFHLLPLYSQIPHNGLFLCAEHPCYVSRTYIAIEL
jgi:hypothetical protein